MQKSNSRLTQLIFSGTPGYSVQCHYPKLFWLTQTIMFVTVILSANSLWKPLTHFLTWTFFRPLISIMEFLSDKVDELRKETANTEKYIEDVLSKYSLYEGDEYDYDNESDDMYWGTSPDEMHEARDNLQLTKLDLVEHYSLWLENRYKIQEVMTACRAASDACHLPKCGEPPEDL